MKKITELLMTLILIFTLAACSVSSPTAATSSSAGQSTSASAVQTTPKVVASTKVASTASTSTVAAPIQNSKTHEEASDYLYDTATVIPITLNSDSITTSGTGVTISGSTATITAAGTYSISGKLSDGQIIVNTKAKEVVRLILNGVEIHSSSSAPIYIAEAKKVVILLADQTQNTLSDAKTYVYAVPAEEEPNAAIFSKSDLTIYGGGALTVTANFQDGITSKDGLIIASGTLMVNAADDGIRGKDYLVIKDGKLTINAKGDGLKSDNEVDVSQGYISIARGVINITAGGDAISAQTDTTITSGEFTLSSGGGSKQKIADTASAKGVKAIQNVRIEGGTYTINSADDGLHTNGNLTINGGTFSIASGDDGMHADATLTINDGDIRVTQSYEGIESAVITINNGYVNVVSSDDGINGAGGSSSGANPGMGGGRPGQNTSAKYFLYVHGGNLYVNAKGDGIDINGSIEMTGGTVLVSGPTEQMNGALDYDVAFKLSGGTVVAAGSSGMAMAPDQTSSQPSVLIYLTASQPAGTLIHIQNSVGEDVLTFAPTKAYQSLAFSSAKLVKGATYTVYTGGKSSGTLKDNLYQGGTYTGGTQVASFTVSGTVTTVGSGGRGGGMR
jgi:hypothetical protein